MSVLRHLVIMLIVLLPIMGEGQELTGLRSRYIADQVKLLTIERPYVPVVYKFLQSYADTVKTLKGIALKNRLANDGIEIKQGGFDQLRLIDEHTTITFMSSKGRYGVNIRSGEFSILDLTFPASFRLLTGLSLKELEARFLHELATFHCEDTVLTCQESMLTPSLLKGYYILKGDAYHLENIRSDIYLEKTGNHTYIPVFSSDHLNESIGNLLLSESTPSSVKLHLVVRQYGFKKKELTIRMKDWIAYCKSRGCQLYWGIENTGPTALKASVFVVNDIMCYDHVMNVEVPYSIVSGEDSIVEGDVNIFIPTHNISTLFQEYELQGK